MLRERDRVAGETAFPLADAFCGQLRARVEAFLRELRHSTDPARPGSRPRGGGRRGDLARARRARRVGGHWPVDLAAPFGAVAGGVRAPPVPLTVWLGTAHFIKPWRCLWCGVYP